MITLDERVRKVLIALSHEPTKPLLAYGWDGLEVWRDDVCALCGGEEKYKHGKMYINHEESCAVKEAKAILADHP